MPDKPRDENFLHIPHDSGEARLRRDQIAHYSKKAPSIEDLAKNRFDIIPSSAIDEDYLADTATHKGHGGKKHNAHGAVDAEATAEANAYGTRKRVTGDNYRQVYMEQAQEAQGQGDPKAMDKLSAAGSKTGKDAETKKALEIRAHARKLSDQIFWWRQQAGQGLYPDDIITNTIDQLERELNGIADVYKN